MQTLWNPSDSLLLIDEHKMNFLQTLCFFRIWWIWCQTVKKFKSTKCLILILNKKDVIFSKIVLLKRMVSVPYVTYVQQNLPFFIPGDWSQRCFASTIFLSMIWIKIWNIYKYKKLTFCLFLSDPGIPGVRSMGPGVSNSLTDKTFCRLNWCESGWWT